MKKQNGLILVSTALLATTITPTVSADSVYVEYADITQEDYIKSSVGKGYSSTDLDKYQGALKVYFETKESILESDVKLVIEIVTAYINIGTKDVKHINNTSDDDTLTKDVNLVNYINSTIQDIKNENVSQVVIADQIIANEKSIKGVKIGVATADFNKAVRAGLDYALSDTSTNKDYFENALEDINDTVVRDELEKAIKILKDNKTGKGETFADLITSDLVDYKSEYSAIYETYYKLSEDTLNKDNANLFVQTINALILATSNTTADNANKLKELVKELPNSEMKTLLDTTSLALESFIIITISDAYNTTKIEDLVKIVSSLELIQTKHNSTIQYDLLKTNTLIKKVSDAYVSTLEDKTGLQQEINLLINTSNSLHTVIKDISMQLLQVTDKVEEDNVVDITDSEVDNTVSYKGYESSARTDLYNPFSDINKTYSKDEILELYHNGKIMKGKTETTFDAHGKVTRAHFAVTIARATGENPDGIKNSPEDIKGKWYENHIQLMISKGIMTTGKLGSDGRFTESKGEKTIHPDVGLQRKDMALYLVRMLKSSGFDVSGLASTSNLLDVDENLTLTDEEKDAIRVLEALDIIHGKPDKTFSPYEVATRAQVAKVLYKTLELTGHI